MGQSLRSGSYVPNLGVADGALHQASVCRHVTGSFPASAVHHHPPAHSPPRHPLSLVGRWHRLCPNRDRGSGPLPSPRHAAISRLSGSVPLWGALNWRASPHGQQCLGLVGTLASVGFPGATFDLSDLGWGGGLVPPARSHLCCQTPSRDRSRQSGCDRRLLPNRSHYSGWYADLSRQLHANDGLCQKPAHFGPSLPAAPRVSPPA